jgi:hypothetical protein
MRLVRTIARTVNRGHAGAVIPRAPAGKSREREGRTGHAQRPPRRSRADGTSKDERCASPHSHHALQVSDVLNAKALVRIVLCEHFELDERFGEDVVRGLYERRTADAKVHNRRPALSRIERRCAPERLEVLVHIEIAMAYSQPPEMTKGASRIFTPVGTVNCDHQAYS